MTTDLPALDTYDAEIVTLTGYYSLRIAEAEEAAASARQALTTAEATLAELTSERANAVHQARERLLTATGAEIRDGGIRGKPGRPTRRVEPVGIGGAGGVGLSTACANANAGLSGGAGGSETPALQPPSGTTEPAIVVGVAEASTILAAPAGEAPTSADAFADAVSEPERTLLRNGFSAEEIADMKPAMQQKLRELGYNRDNVHETGKGVWEEAPF